MSLTVPFHDLGGIEIERQYGGWHALKVPTKSQTRIVCRTLGLRLEKK